MGYNRKTFAVAVLQQLGYRPTPENVRALVGWSRAEGGNWNNSASYNPLNTTLNMPGARPINSVGVKAYGSWDQGIRATVKTLRNGNYGGILGALKHGQSAGAVAQAIGNSPWGTSSSLISSVIGGTPRINVAGIRQPRQGHATRVTVTTPGASNRGLSVPAADLSGLSALLSQPDAPQVPYASPLAAPSFSGQKYLPGGGLQLPATQMPSTQTDGGLAAKLAEIGSLTGPSLTAVAGRSSKTSVVIPATGRPGTSPGITAPGSAPDALRTMIERANAIDSKHYAYEWGGGHNPGVKPTHGTGHGSGPGIGYDCSGVVSKVLGVDARVSGEFERWGKAGKGKQVTVYANGTHVLMEINGHFFGTSSTNPGGGAGWIKRSALPASYLRNFVARHPNGM